MPDSPEEVFRALFRVADRKLEDQMISEKNVSEQSQNLIQRLKEVAGQKLSRKEIFAQKVSFVYGNLPSRSTVTREQVINHLREHEGD